MVIFLKDLPNNGKTRKEEKATIKNSQTHGTIEKRTGDFIQLKMLFIMARHFYVWL